jgi:hypothetical protein
MRDLGDTRGAGAWRGWLAIALVWFFFFSLGYPLASFDDLYFIGAALHLANGQDYSNPYSPAIEIFGAGDKFYCYMPFHSYALMAWLRVFGVDRMTVACFQSLAGAAASAGFWKLMRKTPADVGLALAISLSVITFLGGMGLRPDALGLALLAWGMQLFRAQNRLVWLLCSLALFASAFTCPNFGVVSLFVLAVAFYIQGRAYSFSGRELLVRAGLTVTAFVVNFLVFLAMIHLDLRSFVIAFQAGKDMASHTALWGRIEMMMENPQIIYHLLFASGQPVVTLLFALGLVWLVFNFFSVLLFRKAHRRRPGAPGSLELQNYFDLKLDRFLIGGMLLTSVIVFIPALFSASGQRGPALYLTLTILFLVRHLKKRYRLTGWLVWGGLFLMIFLASGYEIIQVISMPFAPAPPPQRAIRDQVEALNPAHIYVDEFALDSVFDYRLPPHCTDVHFSLLSWKAFVSPEDFPQGTFLVVSKQTAFTMGLRDARARYIPLPSSLLAYLFPNQSGNPYDCVIIPGGFAVEKGP